MNSKWNTGCGCGQCAGCNNCGSVAGESSAPCCDTCGLNTSVLEISATTQQSCGCNQCGGCNSCGSVSDESSAPCCDTCALTINPDGSALVSNQSVARPRYNLRSACANAGRARKQCAAAVRQAGCAACNAASACQEAANACTCGSCAQCQNNAKACTCGGCAQCQNNANACTCGGCAQCQNNANACTCGSCAQCQNNANPCTCGNCVQCQSNAAPCSCAKHKGCGCGSHSACVHHEPQPLGEVFATEAALFQGTLFPELWKPMAAVADCSTCSCATRRQLEAFEAWELRLYLNTHPDDVCAMQRWQQLCKAACKDNYAVAFTGCCDQGTHWHWCQAPWPWEYQSCGCGQQNGHC